MRAPLDRPPLGELVRTGQRVAISVCDITRAQPRRDMLRALFEEMPQVRPEDVTILIATGTHRINTPPELERMLGRDILNRYRVINHDSRDPSSLGRVGVTSTGVEVFLNTAWLDADIRITTGFVEPHFFAGFSGGPKMVAPGLAGLKTVMTLHDVHHIGHPLATWGVTEGNPVHDDVREIARMVPVHFAVDVTLNREQQITAAFAGDILDRASRGLCPRESDGHASGSGALRSGADDELRISARSEPVSGGQGHVGRREDREDTAARSFAPPNAATVFRRMARTARCWRRRRPRPRCSR